MEISKAKNYIDFLSNVQYPAVVFCADGEVLSINKAAVNIIGDNITSISMEPDKFMSSDEFWPTLEKTGTIIWHRLMLRVNKKDKYVVSGFVNKTEYDDRTAYIVLFELRSDVAIGSVSLERIINHIGVVALYLYRPDGVWQTRYVSKNITGLGYKEGDFYKGTVGLQELFVKDDYDILIGNIYKAENSRATDFEMKARLILADSSIMKTTLKCHLVRTVDDVLDGIEFLFIDDKENHISEENNGFIMSVLNKIKTIAVVIQYDHNGTNHVKYITPNARMLGINVEAISAGNKLMIDYVHPGDRDRVIRNAKRALATDRKDYTEEYRVVDDLGKVKWVKAQNSITEANKKSYTVEHLITDITETKNLESSVDKAKKDYEDKLSYIMNEQLPSEEENDRYLDRDRWNRLVKAFSEISRLYSTIIDPEGVQLVEPAGPQENFGKFYDMFEKPQYKDIYAKLNEAIFKNNVPCIMEMDDGYNESRICGAPIMVGDRHLGTWIVCAYDAEDVARMRDIYRYHWDLCAVFSDYVYNSKVVAREAKRSKSIELQFEEKMKRQRIITDALNAMDDDSNATINTIMKQAGEYLGVDVITLYKVDENEDYFCTNFWTRDEYMSADEYIDMWHKGNRIVPFSRNDGYDYILYDENNKISSIQNDVEVADINSFVALLTEVNNVHNGCIVFATSDTRKVWTEDDIEFAKDIRNVIQGVLFRIEGDGNIRNINSILIDTYNFIKVGIFIKDAETGEVLFSNEPLNKKLGYNFTGKNSRTLVEDLKDKFRGMNMGTGSFLSKRDKVTWRSYIKALDRIMDLTEVDMKWVDGRKASLVILKDAQEHIK